MQTKWDYDLRYDDQEKLSGYILIKPNGDRATPVSTPPGMDEASIRYEAACDVANKNGEPKPAKPRRTPPAVVCGHSPRTK